MHFYKIITRSQYYSKGDILATKAVSRARIESFDQINHFIRIVTNFIGFLFAIAQIEDLPYFSNKLTVNRDVKALDKTQMFNVDRKQIQFAEAFIFYSSNLKSENSRGFGVEDKMNLFHSGLSVQHRDVNIAFIEKYCILCRK